MVSFLILFVNKVENPRRGFDKITRCTKCGRVILELSRKRKARQGEEPAAYAVTGDESLNFFVGVCPWEKFRTFRVAKSPLG